MQQVGVVYNAATDAFAHANALLVQLEIPSDTVGYALATAAQHGASVVLNLAPAQPVPDEWFGLVDVWVPNEREAEGLTGIAVTDLERAEGAAKALLDRGAKSVVITLGAKQPYETDLTGEEWANPSSHAYINPLTRCSVATLPFDHRFPRCNARHNRGIQPMSARWKGKG